MRGERTWFEARVRSIKNVTPGIRQFEIVSANGAVPRWSPGSHIEVGIEVNGKPDTRFYSLVGEPDGSCYRLAVKLEQPSRGGSRFMWSLPADAPIRITTPLNLFQLEFDRAAYLLIA